MRGPKGACFFFEFRLYYRINEVVYFEVKAPFFDLSFVWCTAPPRYYIYTYRKFECSFIIRIQAYSIPPI